MIESVVNLLAASLGDFIKVSKERNEIEKRKVKAIEERNEIEQEKLERDYGDEEPSQPATF